MPPRKILSENPPPADSSSEEDEDTESEESEEEEQQTDRLVHDQNGDAEKQEETDDDGSDSDDDDENKSPLKKHTTSAMSDPDLDSELTQPSPSLSAFTIKLNKPSPNPSKAGSKRSTDPEESMLPTKKKSKADNEQLKKAPAIQRLWSEGDELAILDGLIKYKSEKGADPNAYMAAFHEFIKESLHVAVSKSQLSDKIRRLKQKYQANVERGENGQDPFFSKPHHRNCFELSKNIWGGSAKKNDKIDMKLKGKVQSGGGSVTLGLPSLGTGKKQQQVKNVEKKSQVKSREEAKTVEKIKEGVTVVEKQDMKREDEEGDNNVGKLWYKYPLLGESFNGGDLSEGAKLILGDKLGRLEKGKLEELELKWKCLKEAELDLFVRRCQLLNQQVKLALDLINS